MGSVAIPVRAGAMSVFALMSLTHARIVPNETFCLKLTARSAGRASTGFFPRQLTLKYFNDKGLKLVPG